MSQLPAADAGPEEQGSGPDLPGADFASEPAEADALQSQESDTVPAASLEVRPLRSHADYRACVALQKETWGERFSELVPSTILQVSQRVGGVAAGAFAPDGTLVGFVFGITGVDSAGRPIHWSDMLAVREGFRNQGVGQRLKSFQRDTVEARGVETIFWTFDPLVVRNAHLNLTRLGAKVVEYVPDMYGSTDSPLHRGVGTDRFVVAWSVRDPAGRGPPLDTWKNPSLPPPLVNPVPAGPTDTLDLAPARAGAPLVRVQLPADIESVQRRSLGEAAAWRLNTRTALLELMTLGYRVTGFCQDPQTHVFAYLLAPCTEGGAPPKQGPTS